MSDVVHRYLLAYDVASDARRTRIAKTLESYGDRLQYSVFLIDTKPAKLVRLKIAVAGQLDLATDSVLICDLAPSLEVTIAASSSSVRLAQSPHTAHW